MLYESWQDVIKLFNDYFSIAFEAKHKVKYGEGLKILNLKQMLQRLPIVLAQVKADNTSENLLSEIRQIIHSSYQAKEITKKVYSIITNSIKLLNRTDNIFMNSMNSSTPDPRKLLLNFQFQHWLKSWNYLMDLFCIRYSRFFWIYLKKTWDSYWQPFNNGTCK